MSNQDRKQFPKSGNKPQPTPSAGGKAKDRKPGGVPTPPGTGDAGTKKSP